MEFDKCKQREPAGDDIARHTQLAFYHDVLKLHDRVVQ